MVTESSELNSSIASPSLRDSNEQPLKVLAANKKYATETTPKRKFSRHNHNEPVDYKYYLSLQRYDSNCKILKEFIQSNFRDDELIDYDLLHKIDIRNNSNLSFKELDMEFSENSQRVWSFLAENVILRESVILNKHQYFLKNLSEDNFRIRQNKKQLENQRAKEEFRQQLKKNEMVRLNPNNQENASNLIGVEEVEFQKTYKTLNSQLIHYTKDMMKRGYLSLTEQKFIQQGVVWKPIKMAIFGMRPDEIEEKEYYIKNKQFNMVRPVSAGSNKSLKSQGSSRPKLPKIKAEMKFIAPKQFNENRNAASESPTRRMIREMTERIHPFDINRMHKWNTENIRKYKSFIEKFDHKDVMMNLMLLDKQLQDLVENHQKIRQIRDNQHQFHQLCQFLQKHYSNLYPIKEIPKPDRKKNPNFIKIQQRNDEFLNKVLQTSKNKFIDKNTYLLSKNKSEVLSTHDTLPDSLPQLLLKQNLLSERFPEKKTKANTLDQNTGRISHSKLKISKEQQEKIEKQKQEKQNLTQLNENKKVYYDTFSNKFSFTKKNSTFSEKKQRYQPYGDEFRSQSSVFERTNQVIQRNMSNSKLFGPSWSKIDLALRQTDRQMRNNTISVQSSKKSEKPEVTIAYGKISNDEDTNYSERLSKKPRKHKDLPKTKILQNSQRELHSIILESVPRMTKSHFDKFAVYKQKPAEYV